LSDLRTSFLADVPALKFVKDKDAAFMSLLAGQIDDLITAPGSKFGISEEADVMRRIANKFWKENFGTGLGGAKVGKFQTNAVKKTLRAIDQREPEKPRLEQMHPRLNNPLLTQQGYQKVVS